MVAEGSDRQLAILVDSENAQSKLLNNILLEASRYGRVTVRRIYGDWTKDTMKSWHNPVNKYAFKAMNQLNYTKGKNATDSFIIIDAMDILHSGTVDGFCIVSSDSDFTTLAKRIREDGLFVMGIGKECTPESFQNACDVFAHVENISGEGRGIKAPATPHNKEKPGPEEAAPKKPESWIKIVKKTMDIIESEGEWINLSDIGNQIKRVNSSFDPRTYGKKKLSDLIKTRQDHFEIRGGGKTGTSVFYVRAIRP